MQSWARESPEKSLRCSDRISEGYTCRSGGQPPCIIPYCGDHAPRRSLRSKLYKLERQDSQIIGAGVQVMSIEP
jgi:hypothetical protein